MRNKLLLSLFITLFVAMALPQAVMAQEDAYSISLRKDFGYGMGGEIRGTFTIRLIGDEAPVDQVTFLIDGTPIGTSTDAPFRLQFHTDDYDLGQHSLTAEINMQDGKSLQTKPIQTTFISADKEGKFVSSILLGVFGAIVVSIVVVAVIQTVVIKGKKGSKNPQKNHYGLLGGTICPKCGKPFSRHIWGINLVVGRLDRCEHCGKWVMTTRATPSALMAAEKIEHSTTPSPAKFDRPSEMSIEQRLDDSKFIDS